MLSERNKFIYAEAKRRGIDNARAAASTLGRWCPHTPTPPQQRFIDLQCKEALYGGAAGGGKSDAILMGALQHVDEPAYAALILRKTYADLALPGAIMDRSHAWLRDTRAEWRAERKQWAFPSGATVTFGYLENDQDRFRYQSAEFQYIGIDELTQFSELAYRYMPTRTRRLVNSNIPIRIRSASNPGGRGHKWVLNRFVNADTREDREYVPARLGDNPHIDQDEYRQSLAVLDETTRRQMEHGEWVLDAGRNVYAWDYDRNASHAVGPGDWQYVIGVDFGASQAEATTGFAVWAHSKQNPVAYLVEAFATKATNVGDVADKLHSLVSDYGPRRIVADAGALGRGYVGELNKRYRLPVAAAQKQDKLGYRKLMNADLERGKIRVLVGTAGEWVTEAESLKWDEEGLRSDGTTPDHVTDAALYGWREVLSFAHVPAKEPIKEGSPEYWAKVEAEAKQRAVDKIIQRKRTMFGGLS